MTLTATFVTQQVKKDNTFLHLATLVENNLNFFFLEPSNQIFLVETNDKLWEKYLEAFPPGTNPIFRERTEHDCNCCRNFVRNFGNVVLIKGGEVRTIWDLVGGEQLPEPYNTVAQALSVYVRECLKVHGIQGPFFTAFGAYGSKPTLDNKDLGITWNHFYYKVPSRYVVGEAVGAKTGKAVSTKGVFKRALDEFRLSDINDVLDLIKDNNLYRGDQYEKSLENFRRYAETYQNLSGEELELKKELFAWEFHNVDLGASMIRNTAIGTLLTNLAENKGLEQAVRTYDVKVAPGNYRRTTAVVTAGMIEKALETIRGLDLEDSLQRRNARASDISTTDVLWVNNDVSPKMQDPLKSLLMSGVAPTKVTKAKGAQELSVEELLGMRPTKVELILKGEHAGNFMSLTAPVHPEVNPLFSWNNSFGWSYEGDVTDAIKQRVKDAGGDVDALLRTSLAWYNSDDLDLHCYFIPLTGRGEHWFYGHGKGTILDVDANAGQIVPDPVENMKWRQPKDGQYDIKVNQFQKRSTTDVGFQLQFEFNGEIKTYSYNKAVVGSIQVLSFVYKNGEITNYKVSSEMVEGNAISKEKWGINTNTPVPVDMIMLSPNHWDESNKTGTKHYFFILKDCINPDPVRGIYSEFLRPDLVPHRKVFELLGAKTKCPFSAEQLSGVGFSSTKRARVDVLVDSRPYTLVF